MVMIGLLKCACIHAPVGIAESQVNMNKKRLAAINDGYKSSITNGIEDLVASYGDWKV